jgi:hypothetical protein
MGLVGTGLGVCFNQIDESGWYENGIGNSNDSCLPSWASAGEASRPLGGDDAPQPSKTIDGL